MAAASIDFYFLNVGHGDCTIVDFQDRLTMIDINNSRVLDPDSERELSAAASSAAFGAYLNAAVRGDYRFSQDQYEAAFKASYQEKLVDPVEWLRVNFPGRALHRFILTHPDMDHMSGLYALRRAGLDVLNFWDTNHWKTFSPLDFEHAKYDFRDWEEYQRILADTSVRKLNLHRGAIGSYYSEDGISIWSPTSSLELQANITNEWNRLSYVLAVQHFGNLVILGGDADEVAWQDILETHEATMRDSKVVLLKASHHGRDSGYHQPSVAAMRPDNTIISVGKLPDSDASSKYRRYSNVYTTRFRGSIKATVWYDGEVWLYDADGKRMN